MVDGGSVEVDFLLISLQTYPFFGGVLGEYIYIYIYDHNHMIHIIYIFMIIYIYYYIFSCIFLVSSSQDHKFCTSPNRLRGGESSLWFTNQRNFDEQTGEAGTGTILVRGDTKTHLITLETPGFVGEIRKGPSFNAISHMISMLCG